MSVARLPWPHFGRTRMLNAAIYCALASSISAGQRRDEQVGGRRETVYGSDAQCRFVPNGWSSKVRTLSVTAGCWAHFWATRRRFPVTSEATPSSQPTTEGKESAEAGVAFDAQRSLSERRGDFGAQGSVVGQKIYPGVP